MKQLRLKREGYALVDDEDYERLKSYRYRVDKDGYAIRSGGYQSAPNIRLHHDVLGDGPRNGFVTDHIDHNKLNCQKANLRWISRVRNTSKKQTANSSQYLGVSWDSVNDKWAVELKHEGVRYRLGRFVDEVDAAKAYDKKALELGRKPHDLNFPPN